jgi:hypothetical protein
MSHKLSCVITGKTITVSNEYYDKKVIEFGTEDKLNKLYVSRQVKNLLKRGYKVKEIKNLLKIEDNSLPNVSDSMVKEILRVKDEESNTYENSSIKKSDPEVVEYINTLRSYLSC